MLPGPKKGAFILSLSPSAECVNSDEMSEKSTLSADLLVCEHLEGYMETISVIGTAKNK